VIDRLLKTLTSRSLRRGLAGEPLWLALALAAWLVQRSRNRGPSVVWSGRLQPGERLVLSSFVPGEGQAAAPPD
jgi:hypothetical protein